MADLIFKISPNIILGSYTLSRLAQYVKEYGSRFMLIIDPVLKDVNLQEKVTDPLIERNVDFILYNGLTDGANSKEISQALKLARQSHVHAIIAVGGAKALYAGMAVASLYNEEKSIHDYFDGTAITKEALPVICIPSTFRAPYAFTNTIPLTDSRNHQMKFLKIQNNVCRLLIWDPNLSLTLTENQKMSLSLESLCIASEAYLSQKASFFSDMFAEKSFLIFNQGLNSAATLNTATPQELLLEQGGCMASLAASSSSVGIANMLALTLNSRFKISRSLASSILFPFVIEEVAKYKLDRIEKISHLFGAAPEDVQKEDAATALAQDIRQKMAKVNLPVRLKDLNLSFEQLALAAEDAGSTELMSYLPRSMTTDDLFEFMKLAF